MVTTNTPEYADRIRIMSLHGISKDAWKRYRSDGTHSYEILYPGYKYNLTDLAAALGIEQLKKCEQFWRRRAQIAGMYDAAFADVAEIRRPVSSPHVEHAWHLYVIQLVLDEIGITRDEFIDQLKQHHIGTSVHFMPLHLHPLYRDMFGYRPQDFPVATSVSSRIVSLPIYPAMTDEDVNDVVEAVRAVIAAARQRSRVAVNTP
jgi:perosamine synthetase